MSNRDNWATPPAFWDAVRGIWWPTLDVCADETNYKCADYFDAGDDGLKQRWVARSTAIAIAWCNPPGSQVGRWVDKAISECVDHGVESLVLTVTSNAPWYQRAMPLCHTFLLYPRVQFLPPSPDIEKSSDSRDRMLLWFHPAFVAAPGPRVSIWRWRDE